MRQEGEGRHQLPVVLRQPAASSAASSAASAATTRVAAATAAMSRMPPMPPVPPMRLMRLMRLALALGVQRRWVLLRKRDACGYSPWTHRVAASSMQGCSPQQIGLQPQQIGLQPPANRVAAPATRAAASSTQDCSPQHSLQCSLQQSLRHSLRQGRVAMQGCRAWLQAELQGRVAGQGCRAGLHGRVAGPGCMAGLQGRAAGQGCRAALLLETPQARGEPGGGAHLAQSGAPGWVSRQQARHEETGLTGQGVTGGCSLEMQEGAAWVHRVAASGTWGSGDATSSDT